MTKIYLLTAPFDEEAKTGDGQYAASLKSGFTTNYSDIQCTWLKRNDGHYAIPLPAGCTSIPHDTIPSAEVLQPVANKRTAISGYKLLDPESSPLEAEEVNRQTVSPKTPKVILRGDGSLHSITIMDIYSQKPIQLNREKTNDLLNKLDAKMRHLTEAVASNMAGLQRIAKPKDKQKHLVSLYEQNKEIQEHCSLNEYIEAHFGNRQLVSRYEKAYGTFRNLLEYFENPVNLNELEAISDTITGIKDYPYDFHSNNLTYDIENDNQFRKILNFNQLKITTDSIIENLKSLRIRQSVAERFPDQFSQINDPSVLKSDKLYMIQTVFQEGYSSTHDQEQFTNALLNPHPMDIDLASPAAIEEAIETYQHINNKVNTVRSTNNILNSKPDRTQFIAELQALLLKKEEPYLTSNTKLDSFYAKRKFSAAEGFHLAYQANQQDSLKDQVIDNIIQSMAPVDDETYLDIHIRPPDCGVFISPGDIVKFKEAGIKVNITIHEYKQNYTRRYLQQYTHDLMRQADTVQFFNELDRNNAIIAATFGDCDKRNTEEPSGIAKKAREVGLDFELEQFPVQPYDLEGKSGLTVASQQLSTSPSHPLDVIRRPPNILSFGTIRPGKGFEEAIQLAQLIKNDAETIKDRINAIPIVKLAGDPQDKKLMQDIVEERFGKDAVETYQLTHPYDAQFSNAERRTYWKGLVNELNALVDRGEVALNNSFIEIHPWCEDYQLLELKESCKYVCRMDDMGMRNNGSAIISVLDVGIVYTKFGTVTDDIFTKTGQYGRGVDIGEYRYGIYNLLRREELFKAQNPEAPVPLWLRKNPDSDYKRKSGSRDPKEILDSIIARELNQLENNPKSSDNYQTVVEAQKLLTERFTLKNAVNHLLRNVGLEHLIVAERIDPIFDEAGQELYEEEQANELAQIIPRRFMSQSYSGVGFFGSSCASQSGSPRDKMSHSLDEELVDGSTQQNKTIK
ncbi:hypothetical protein ELY21_14305 [Legionella sp. km535]|uniref:Dot/Icm T4SS effector Ceg32/SidI n=1 Tax=Legionella sp. km535 TaxID=2498107 RepID=UPI000F8E691F|nr:Dot/Icm T4SS effector Ceg32/SidI [Legionella sp. km535]RUR15675.1 hypothetical protein ELY21_14305 [Legionella sp. km535]